MELENSRKKINEYDKELTFLFEKRMEIVKKIAEYKRDNNIPVENTEREKEIIKNNSAFLKDEDFKEYFAEFTESIFKISKKYQKSIIEKNGR